MGCILKNKKNKCSWLPWHSTRPSRRQQALPHSILIASVELVAMAFSSSLTHSISIVSVKLAAVAFSSSLTQASLSILVSLQRNGDDMDQFGETIVTVMKSAIESEIARVKNQ